MARLRQRRGRLRRATRRLCLVGPSGEQERLEDLVRERPLLVWIPPLVPNPSAPSPLAGLRAAAPILRELGVRAAVVTSEEAASLNEVAAHAGRSVAVLSGQAKRICAAFRVDPATSALTVLLLDSLCRVRWRFEGQGPGDRPPLEDIPAALSRDARLSIPGPSDVLTPVVAVLVFLTLALLSTLAFAANDRLLFWDLPVSAAIQDFGGNGVRRLMRLATRLGNRWLIAALTLVGVPVVWGRCRQLAVSLAAAFPLALILELLLKAVIDRPRPPLGAGFGASFPSGHVLAAAAFWGLLPPWTFLMSRRPWAWRASAIASGSVLAVVGVSRVYLGAHWPSDVVGGYLAGALFLLIAEWAIRSPWPALGCRSCDLHAWRGQKPVARGHPLR